MYQVANLRHSNGLGPSPSTRLKLFDDETRSHPDCRLKRISFLGRGDVLRHRCAMAELRLKSAIFSVLRRVWRPR